MQILVKSKITNDYVEPYEVAIDETNVSDDFYEATLLCYAVDTEGRLLVCGDNGNFAYALVDEYNVYIDYEG